MIPDVAAHRSTAAPDNIFKRLRISYKDLNNEIPVIHKLVMVSKGNKISYHLSKHGDLNFKTEFI